MLRLTSVQLAGRQSAEDGGGGAVGRYSGGMRGHVWGTALWAFTPSAEFLACSGGRR